MLALAFPALCAFAFAGGALSQNATDSSDDQTDITKKLNGMIAKSQSGIYKGGHGVLVRAMNDGLSSTVVPATLLVNDIIPPSTMYPDGNPMCPNNGWSGYNKANSCSDDPFARAQVGAVIGTNLPNLFKDGSNIQSDHWQNGVFYGSDSNSADQRCRWSSKYNGYDCPGGWIPWDGSFASNPQKLGAGNYASGNPNAGGGGGGAGCHFSIYDKGIDQFDAVKGNTNLVSNQWCECNYNLNGNWWQDWVQQWINYGKAKQGFEWMGWFGKGKAPSFGMDFAMCWVNNPRDMIQIQNAMWWFKDDWNNRLLPESPTFNDKQPSSQRRYWGWNEIPLDRSAVNKPVNWDAIVIKLPPAACGSDGKDDHVKCLSNDSQNHLEQLLSWYVSQNYLKPGLGNIAKRPGSYVVFLKEYYVGNRAWERGFFCESWTSPNNKYSVVFETMSADTEEGTGKCYMTTGSSPTPPPPPPPPHPTPSPHVGGAPIRYGPNQKKCIDISGGSLKGGNPLQIWDCNNIGANQNWVYQQGDSLRSALDNSKCLDFGNPPKRGNPLLIQDCHDHSPSQKIWYDNHDQSYYTGQDPNWLCIDLPYGHDDNGKKLVLWDCKGNHEQRWTPPPPPQLLLNESMVQNILHV